MPRIPLTHFYFTLTLSLYIRIIYWHTGLSLSQYTYVLFSDTLNIHTYYSLTHWVVRYSLTHWVSFRQYTYVLLIDKLGFQNGFGLIHYSSAFSSQQAHLWMAIYSGKITMCFVFLILPTSYTWQQLTLYCNQTSD